MLINDLLMEILELLFTEEEALVVSHIPAVNGTAAVWFSEKWWISFIWTGRRKPELGEKWNLMLNPWPRMSIYCISASSLLGSPPCL